MSEIVKVEGELISVLDKIPLSSVLTSSELVSFYARENVSPAPAALTANFVQYRVEEKECFIYFGEKEGNPFLVSSDPLSKCTMSDEAQLRIFDSVKSGSTVKLPLSEVLEFEHTSDYDSWFDGGFHLSADGFSSLPKSRRSLVDKLIGNENDFINLVKVQGTDGKPCSWVAMQDAETVKNGHFPSICACIVNHYYGQIGENFNHRYCFNLVDRNHFGDVTVYYKKE